MFLFEDYFLEINSNEQSKFQKTTQENISVALRASPLYSKCLLTDRYIGMNGAIIRGDLLGEPTL